MALIPVKLGTLFEDRDAVSTLISQADAKAHLRVKHTEEDSLIDIYVTAAYDLIRHHLKRPIISEDWTGRLDCFPENSDVLDLRWPDCTNLDEITYYDEDAALQKLATSVYQTDFYSVTGRVLLKDDQEWPDTEENRANAIEITYSAGWTVANVPPAIVQAIKIQLTWLYDNRMDVTVGPGFAASVPLSQAAHALISPWKYSEIL